MLAAGWPPKAGRSWMSLSTVGSLGQKFVYARVAWMGGVGAGVADFFHMKWGVGCDECGVEQAEVLLLPF